MLQPANTFDHVSQSTLVICQEQACMWHHDHDRYQSVFKEIIQGVMSLARPQSAYQNSIGKPQATSHKPQASVIAACMCSTYVETYVDDIISYMHIEPCHKLPQAQVQHKTQYITDILEHLIAATQLLQFRLGKLTLG